MKFKPDRYGISLIVLILGYALFEYYRPKPIDWTDTYSNKDKIPFGTEVLFKLLPSLTGNRALETIRIPPYNQLTDSSLKVKSSYVFIIDRFNIDQNDQQKLLKYAEAGNTVFISAYYFADSLMKVLGLEALAYEQTLKKDTAKVVNFVNPLLKNPKGYLFSKDDGSNYLKVIKPGKITLLAENEKHDPVFVRVNYGKGYFYIHNLPLAFTNYYVLDEKLGKHTFAALSYLPEQPILWDEYLKQGRFENESSVFRYIVSQPALKMAYILTIVGFLLYMIFAGKRKQRVIPLMNPPANISLEFVKTIGNMYYRKGDHHNLAQKLVFQFQMFVWERFGINPQNMTDNELIQELKSRSDMDENELKDLTLALVTDDYNPRNAARLMDLNQKLEGFYEKMSKGY